MNKIFILKNDWKKITIRESTVLLFIKIKDSIVTPFWKLKSNKYVLFDKKMKGKEEKRDKKELDFEVYCRETAKDFPITDLQAC